MDWVYAVLVSIIFFGLAIGTVLLIAHYPIVFAIMMIIVLFVIFVDHIHGIITRED